MVVQATSGIRVRIVDAAVVLFARQGYRGTSTREIARVADVSEVTLYRYFERKDELFCSALQLSIERINPRLESLSRSAQRSKPEVVLPEIISFFMDIATFSPELVRLIAIAFGEMKGRSEELCRERLAPLFASISEYLTENIESGRIRHVNPSIATVAMAITVIAQPELARLVGENSLSQLAVRDVIREYSRFWLNVLVPDSPHLCNRNV